MPTVSDEVLLESAVFLYLACAKLTDGDLDPDEAVAIGEQVHELIPRLSPAYADALMREVAGHFGRLNEPAAILDEVVRSAERLAEGLDSAELERVVGGLISIANAGGTATPEEREYVVAVARTFGVTLSDDA